MTLVVNKDEVRRGREVELQQDGRLLARAARRVRHARREADRVAWLEPRRALGMADLECALQQDVDILAGRVDMVVAGHAARAELDAVQVDRRPVVGRDELPLPAALPRQRRRLDVAMPNHPD